MADEKPVSSSSKVLTKGTSLSVGSIIKLRAVQLHPAYAALSTSNKAIVSLGLNSVLDTSFKHPNVQTSLFTRQQWEELKARYKAKAYNHGHYTYIKTRINAFLKLHEDIFDNDLSETYRCMYDMSYRPDFREKDVSFCTYFLKEVVRAIIYQPLLFDSESDFSVFDFLVKFWGPVFEELFTSTNLRLKWGKTSFTVVLDKILQGYNIENKIAVMEASEEDPKDSSFTFNRCKVSIENKIIIDKCLKEGIDISSVDSLQISGLQVFFINTFLSDGIYSSTEFYHMKITNSYEDIPKYIDLALNLLCFRDSCVAISKVYNCQGRLTRSMKRSLKDAQTADLASKQDLIRDTWNPPLDHSRVPAIPKDIWK